jgi:hypothetical protein
LVGGAFQMAGFMVVSFVLGLVRLRLPVNSNVGSSFQVRDQTSLSRFPA